MKRIAILAVVAAMLTCVPGGQAGKLKVVLLAAPSNMPEFQGNVAFTKTTQFYDPKLKEYVGVYSKCASTTRRELGKLAKERGVKKIPKDETPQERSDKCRKPWLDIKTEWLNVRGDKGGHFFGSGRIFCQMGDAFGRDLVELVDRDGKQDRPEWLGLGRNGA